MDKGQGKSVHWVVVEHNVLAVIYDLANVWLYWINLGLLDKELRLYLLYCF